MSDYGMSRNVHSLYIFQRMLGGGLQNYRLGLRNAEYCVRKGAEYLCYGKPMQDVFHFFVHIGATSGREN